MTDISDIYRVENVREIYFRLFSLFKNYMKNICEFCTRSRHQIHKSTIIRISNKSLAGFL